jgi:hypothetical protein
MTVAPGRYIVPDVNILRISIDFVRGGAIPFGILAFLYGDLLRSYCRLQA